MFAISKYLSTKNLFITKERKSDSIVTKPGRHYLNEGIKVNISSHGTKRHCVLSNRMHWEEQVYNIQLKIYDLDLIGRKHQRNPTWKTFFKMILIKSTGKTKELSQRERDYKGLEWLGTTPNPGLMLYYKGCCWNKIWMESLKEGYIEGLCLNSYKVSVSLKLLQSKICIQF